MEGPPAPPADAAVDPPPIEAEAVAELMRALGTALRSHRLYGGDEAMLERFVDAVRAKLAGLWDEVDRVRLEIDEKQIRWEDRVVYPAGGESAELAFLFYKDGIRTLTLLPGFEDELMTFLGVVGRAPQLRPDEDDLVTLLWQADLAGLRYDYVEVGAEEVEVSAGGRPPEPVPADAVREEAGQPSRGLTPEDFQETLYFLDDAETRRLAEELQLEADRDLWRDVTAALFDRLEDGGPDRQMRILRIVQELLAHALGAGEIDRAAAFLAEIAELAGRPDRFDPEVLREVRALFEKLASEEMVRQLALTLEEHPETLRKESLGTLLEHFPPTAVAPLMRAVGTVGRPDVRRIFEQAVDRLAAENREEVVRLLEDDDPGVVAAAARWTGRLGIGTAAPVLVRLLGRPELPVRIAAVDALQELRAAAAGRALTELLDDPERELRLAAVRALCSLQYTAARAALEEVLLSRRLRAADRTEKVAFFEAYGQLAGAEGIALLERTLNRRGWLGRGETTEMRACAALALGRVRHPSARAALAAAASDSDPVVRTAVARATREAQS